jgi:hypothetical protein
LFPNDSTPESGAELSECQHYRYRLWRRVGEGGSVVFVMLNPSTADAHEDDPTIRRCKGFVRAWGHGELVVVNLFAYRATNPKDMLAASDPVGPRNDGVLRAAIEGARLVVCAWGSAAMTSATVRYRARAVEAMIGNLDVVPVCLGATKNGDPRHPLFVRKDTQPVTFKGSP